MIKGCSLWDWLRILIRQRYTQHKHFFITTSLCFFLLPLAFPQTHTHIDAVPGCSGGRGRPGFEGREPRSRELCFSQYAERWGRRHSHRWSCTSHSSHTAPAGPQQQLAVETASEIYSHCDADHCTRVQMRKQHVTNGPVSRSGRNG